MAKGNYIPIYAVAFQEACKSNDGTLLRQLADQAAEYVSHAEDVRHHLPKLLAALSDTY